MSYPSEVGSQPRGAGGLVWIIGTVTLLFGALMASVISVASASPSAFDPHQNFSVAPALQSPATPTATVQITPTSTYSFTLAALGYTERTLTSPYGQAQYSMRLPENWAIQTEGALDLDLSYNYNQVNIDEYPAQFGDLTVTFDGQTLEIFSIDQAELEHYRLHVSLPTSLLASPDQTQHILEVSLDAGFLCAVPHKAKLVIHPTSTISLTYSLRPLVLDLARYPRPFYQRAFEPDSVRFVVPAKSSASDLSNTLAIAAKLGDLTSNRMVVTTTTDLDLSRLLAPVSATLDEHLIVIGQPQDNQALRLLNDAADLPVSLHPRQLALITQGPEAVASADTFAYVFTITNTLERSVDLSLVDSLPPYTELKGCTPDCIENSDKGIVTWADNQLAPTEVTSFSLTLKASDVLTGTAVENTLTLVEAELGPINSDTLTSTVMADSSHGKLQVSAPQEGSYFFVYDGKAVAQGDGIIQEIPSPWNPGRAILIVTGLSDEAVRKASQAMSSETRFPGMSGAVALVREALLPSEIDHTALMSGEMTFADLGYDDKIIWGTSAQQVDYRFEVPGWQLTDEATIDLYFSHSQHIDAQDSGLTVLLNKKPFASVALDDENSDKGLIHISLANADIQTGENRLTVSVDMSLPGECTTLQSEQAWLRIKNTSRIFLAHHPDTASKLALNYLPYPFDLDPSMTDLMFALPDTPTVGELGAALRLAASLGNSAGGKTIMPVVMTGNDHPLQAPRDYHIIALGRPSRIALIQQVNAQLPQPFLPGSDEIEQRVDDVVLRLPPGIDLGYLQLIPSPWNEARALLTVTGTTDNGLNGAVNIASYRTWELKSGNLAVIRGSDVNTIDTRELTRGGMRMAVMTVVPEMTPMAAAVVTAAATITPASPVPNPTPGVPAWKQALTRSNPPGWLFPLVGMTVLVVVAISVFALRQARLKQ
jgi:hypothetical protein